MANIYKRYGAWVTGLRSNLFTWARIKLTATYVLIIILILTVFSLILYFNLTKRLRRDDLARHSEYTVTGVEENPVEDSLEKLEASIITADVVVLLITGGLSYWLAGYTLKPIRTAMDAQTRFSAEASHELRTPLAVMRTGTEVLLRGNHNLSPETKEVLTNNLEEIDLMSTMTDQLLELSRGKNKKPEKFNRLNLKDIAQNTIGKLSKLADKKEIRLTAGNLSDSVVNGKKDDLERMLKNIITNSITHTAQKGQITVSVSNEHGFAEISTTDTGVGITEKDLPHIFEAFYKADKARATVDNQPGSGLGLAIVKQITEQHHGTIEVKSVVNKGTTVTIRLPLA